MRYIMKGGVWKNSEDEILKAAIMKYGLNQWSRISSLLPRKSAKQCKQRWYQWLDPSIKKTQWTRDQDQKLLQLARVFPSQWRTVAPFVGRTPAQCFERYEKLLDMAQGKDPNQTDALRKLRPGEIDPNPETKPARPDPIDMDQDEKQMLAEVRVRLANTKGKKAKRKEREKYIDEARRLARLQKARELTMAGVENIVTQQELKRLRQRRDINYNKEVPFKRDVPDFAYQTQKGESPAGNVFALNMSLQALQGRRRDVEEQKSRKEDKRRIKKLNEKDPQTLINPKLLNKPPPAPISLPEPQLNDRDLEELKRINPNTPLNTILSQKATTPTGMTPHNKLMFQARVNYQLNSVGPEDRNQQDIDGVEGLMMLNKFKKQEKMSALRGQGMSPSVASRLNTPLNGWDYENNSSKLKSLFKNLARPQNVVEFEIPEEQEEDQKEDAMDAEEFEKQEAEQERIVQQLRLQRRNDVLKKQLPRIKTVPTKLVLKLDPQSLVAKEYISLVYSDAVDYPFQGMELPAQQINYKQEIDEQYIKAAKELISLEVPAELKPVYSQIQEIRRHTRYNPKTKRHVYDPEFSGGILQNYQLEFSQHVLTKLIQKALLKRTDQLQKKTNVLLNGYHVLIQKNTSQMNDLLLEYEEARLKKDSLLSLRAQQQQSIVSQLEELKGYYQLIYKSV